MRMFILTTVFACISLFGHSQDKYTKLAFIQTRAENTALFEKDGFKQLTSDERPASEDYFKRTLNDDEYQLIYSNHDVLESITVFSAYEGEFYEFMSDCREKYTEVPSDDDENQGTFESESFRYEFSIGYDFVGLMYITKVVKL